MKFSEALSALEDGRPVRRSGSRYQWIRRVDPRVEPDIDGPSRAFVIVGSDGRYMSNHGEFEAEEDAKACLKKLRASLTKEHKAYKETQEAFDAASPEDKEKKNLKPGMSPMFRENYYDGASILERNASRTTRINVPYIIGMTRENTIEVVSLTGSDIFAPDWSIA